MNLERDGDLGLQREVVISQHVGYLKKLAEHQRSGFTAGSVEQVATDSRKHLLNDFKNSRGFKRLYGELVNFVSMPVSEEKFNEIRKDFIGAVFANMAYTHLVWERTDSSTLISPKRTLDFYKRLYPGAQRTNNPFGGDSLEGISVPDGIKVNSEGEVVAVCEYTTHGGNGYFVNKLDAVEYEKASFPEIFAEARLVVVTPRFRGGPLYSNVIHVELPLHHGQFRDFINGVFSHYRVDEDSATIAEVRQEARRQFERATEAERRGSLTFEMRRYLERVRRAA